MAKAKTRKKAQRATRSLASATAPVALKLPKSYGTVSLTPPDVRQSWLSVTLVFLLVFAVYAITAPATIALEDDGDFVFAVHSFGIAHPPGYPLFVWLAKPFTWIPFGEIAWRVHLASAAFGAATCGVIWWIASTLTGSRAAGWISSLGFGFSGAFWSQAIVAEIYTLNTLVLFGLLGLAFAYLHHPRPKLIWFMGLLFGLGLSNHWPLLVLASPALALILMPTFKAVLREIPKALLAMAVGLLPYLWMAIRSQTNPEFGFYGAMNSWAEFWFVVSREGYASVDQSSTASWQDKWFFLGFLGKEAFVQFTPLGAALAMIGAVKQWRSWGLWVSLGLASAFLSASLLLVLLLNFDYEYLGRSLFRVYPLVPWGILALWMALGAATVFDWIANQRPQLHKLASTALCAVVVLGTLIWHWQPNDRRNYDHARDYATTLLEALEPNAILFTMGDVDAYTIRYYRYVRGIRPDIDVIAQNGIGYSSKRLFPPRATTGTRQAEIVTEFAMQQERPVYFIHGEPGSMTGINYGAFQKAVKPTNEPKTIYAVNEDTLAMLNRVAANEDSRDPWTIRHRRILMNTYGSWLSFIVHRHPDRAFAKRFEPLLDRLSATVYSVAMTRMNVLRGLPGDQHKALVRRIHEQAMELIDDKVSKSNHAIWWNYAGQFATEDGNNEKAVEAFERSYNISSNSGGAAVYHLLTIHAALKHCDEYRHWRDVFSSPSTPKKLQSMDRTMERQCGKLND